MAQLFGDESGYSGVLGDDRGGDERRDGDGRLKARVQSRRPHAIKVGEISTGLSCLCHFLSGCRGGAMVTLSETAALASLLFKGNQDEVCLRNFAD
jgi:hypothetical protein